MLGLRTLALPSKIVLSVLLAGVACAQAEGLTSDRQAANGGSGDDTGGSGDTGGGGTSSAGGTTNGGTVAASGGMAAASGGAAPATGGTATTGGASSKGGSTSSGGASKGGSTGTGGTAATTGGSSAKGGSASTGAPGSTLLSDDFEDKDATDWYAADMNGTRAVSMQAPSYAYVMTSTDKALSVGGNVGWTDQRVEAKIKFIEAANSPVLYLMARWAETKSYLVVEVRPGETGSPGGDMKLRQTEAGSTTDLCRFKPASLLPDTWYTIGVSIKGGQGSTATLLFNGQPVTTDKACTLSKAGPAAGGIALGIQDGSAAFDDVRVTVPE